MKSIRDLTAASRRGALGAVLIAVVAAGCGGGGSADLELSPAGVAGRTTSNANGCGSCHGNNGQGGVGPGWQGLFGSEVQLADGTTVIADDAYLMESILDPGAKIVAGYNLMMPPNELSEQQARSILDYIHELADVGG